MKEIKLNKKGRDFYRLLEKTLPFFVEVSRLYITYGLILVTPAKEIKKMKLRQIEKELKMLTTKKEEAK